MLIEGQKAPAFSLPDSQGKFHKLSDYKGRKVVLYFYPKDDTPGCTKEACSFRDDFAKYSAKNAVIIGISADKADSHTKFKEKFGLPFILLSDTDKKVIKDYGAWQEKSMYGKKFMGIQRTTFIIDENRKIIKIFPKVSVDGHSYEILSIMC